MRAPVRLQHNPITGRAMAVWLRLRLNEVGPLVALLGVSILGYGLPDFAAGAFNAPAARETLRREIEQAIRRFEPRLSDVKVTLLDSRSTMTPILRIRVAGVLRIPGGDSEPVTFDTALDTASADMTVGDAAYG